MNGKIAPKSIVIGLADPVSQRGRRNRRPRKSASGLGCFRGSYRARNQMDQREHSSIMAKLRPRPAPACPRNRLLAPASHSRSRTRRMPGWRSLVRLDRSTPATSLRRRKPRSSRGRAQSAASSAKSGNNLKLIKWLRLLPKSNLWRASILRLG